MVPDIDLTAEEAVAELETLRESLQRLVEARSARRWSPREAQEYIRLAGREATLLHVADAGSRGHRGGAGRR